MLSILQTHPLLKIMNSALIDLPSPSSLSGWWNFGSLLGLCLVTQLFSGILLAMWFIGDSQMAFFSVTHLSFDVNLGWLTRMIHANGASFFFICLYAHAARGIYYGSSFFVLTWGVGVVILLATMAAAFLGYVLPWGQMSFWGASVITGLFSAIPYLGPDIVIWLWGSFAVDSPTLTRFFSFHFLVPFIIAALVIVHLIFLHQQGSNNPLGLILNQDKIPFHPYFTIKDLVGVYTLWVFLIFLIWSAPWMLGDPENFILANPLVTPVHIQPEWYFLFAYAILRSIPNKLGGVIALVMSILIFLSFIPMKRNQRSIKFYWTMKNLFWAWISLIILLTWIGARPVEEPYIKWGQIFTITYFIFFPVFFLLSKNWDSLMKE